MELNWPTLLRLGIVIALAIVVRQAVLYYGRRAIDKRKDSDSKNKRRR